MIKKYPICLNCQNLQPSEPIINHSIPSPAWTKIAVDPFHLYENYHLLMIDYYSKFIIIETLKNLQSSTVINECKKILSQFGTLKEIMGPNSLTIILNRFQEPGILNIGPLVSFFQIQWISRMCYTSC